MKPTFTTDYRAAISQAGHAVASHYFGVRFEQVAINGIGLKHWKNRNAELWHQLRGTPTGKPWTEATIERRTLFAVCILMAGDAALQRAGLPADEVSPSLDAVQEYAAALKPVEERDPYLQDCRELTEKLINKCWPWVERIAGELQAVRKLTGKQAAALLEAIPLEPTYNRLFLLGNDRENTTLHT